MNVECVVNRKLILVINSCDDNYVPNRIIVMGGSSGNLRKLNDITIDQSVLLSISLCLAYTICLEYMDENYFQ